MKAEPRYCVQIIHTKKIYFSFVSELYIDEAIYSKNDSRTEKKN